MSAQDEADGLAIASLGPAATSLHTSMPGMFNAGYDASKRNSGAWATYGNLSAALQDHLDEVKRKTNIEFGNPLADYTTNPKASEILANATQALAELAEKRNDPSLAMPDSGRLFQMGAEKARASSRDYERLAGGPASFASRMAGVLGGLGGGFTDPEYLVLSALGFALIPQGGPLAVSALRSAAGFAAGQTAATMNSFAYKQAVNPEYGYGDAAKEVAFAAGLGAGTAVAGATLGAAWRALRSRSPSAASMIPAPLQDAGSLAERVEELDANNPFRTGLAGVTAHREAISQLSMDLAAGKELVEVSPAAQAEAKVPAGQVFAAPGHVFLGNRAVDVKYELAEAGDLVTSHTRDFMANPAYPGELQPRERANAASRSQVIDMAANLEPERLGPSPEANTGAPIVGPDNIVESGNGRVMAIRLAYDDATDRAGAYRSFLERSGHDTAGFRNPVLAARRTTPMDAGERAAFAQAANGSASLRMSTMEQAISDARHIGPDLAPLLNPGDLGAAANRDFAKAFVAKLPLGERGGFLTQGGQISAAGLQRIRAATFARAYGGPAFIARAFEHPDSNIKTLAAALTDAAPEWVKLKELIAQGGAPSTHDITPDLMNAVKAIMQARDTGRPVHEILNQGDMFHSDVSGLAARLFFKDAEMKKFRSRPDMADNLAAVARDIRTSAEAGPDMFGQAPVMPAEALAALSRIPRATVEEMGQLRADTAFAGAMIADLRRDIDRGDAHIGMTEDGKPILADPEFHAAEQQEMLAKEIGNCITGLAEVAG